MHVIASSYLTRHPYDSVQPSMRSFLAARSGRGGGRGQGGGQRKIGRVGGSKQIGREERSD
jgi:hypothetical protein